ncbi:aminotransferase class V-fold PLP-dependent enzyme [Saccharothrix isguenensis]
MGIPASYLVQFHEPDGYLDFARFGPPSFAVVDASTRLLEASAAAGPATVDDLMRQGSRARAAAARLCRTSADRVALLPNTSTGLFQVASGVRGEVLVSAGEFPANTYPWARSPAVDVSWLPAGPVTADAVRAALTPATVAVSVSAVDFRTGYRADLAALRQVVGDRLLVVDGIQGFGVVDEPWEAADVLVVGGQKWLRAGWSTGFTTLSDRALDRLDPVLSGWTGAVDPGLFDDAVHPVAGGAAGWSITHLSPIAAGALAAALELVELAGVGNINARIGARLDELADVVHAVGGEVVPAVDRRAGILAFSLPDRPPSAIGAALAEAGVTATVRTDHVRLSPHASTTRETVARFAAALRDRTPAVSRATSEVEALPADVGALRRLLVERAVASVGVPVELMKKSHRTRVVRLLDDAGLFLIKDSVDYLADALGVTRFTIYNYLNETRG